MRKNLIVFLCLIIIPILVSIYLVTIFPIEKEREGYNIVNKFNNMYSTIEITDDGNVNVEQTVEFNELKKSDYPYEIRIEFVLLDSLKTKISTYDLKNKSDNNKEYIDKSLVKFYESKNLPLPDSYVFIGDKVYDFSKDTLPFIYEYSGGCCSLIVEKDRINDFNTYLKENNNKIKIKYSLNSSRVLVHNRKKEKVYLYLSNNAKFNETNTVNVIFPNSLTLLNKKSTLQDKKFSIELNLKNFIKKDSFLEFDDNFVKDGQISTSIGFVDIDTTNISCFVLIVSTCVLAVIVIVAHLRKMVKIVSGRVIRDPKEVISPILAESLIDGKIDAKDLIMTVMVDLVKRGNLEYLEDGIFKIKSIDGLNELERECLKFAFGLSSSNILDDNAIGSVRRLDTLSEIFKFDNKRSLEIYSVFYEIKTKIRKVLIDERLLSSIWDKVLKEVRILSLLLIIDLLFFFALGGDFLNYDEIGIYFLIGNIAFIVITNTNTPINFITKKTYKTSESSNLGSRLYLVLIFCPVMLLVMRIIEGKIDIFMQLIFSILIIINCLVNRFANTYVFTAKGKQEYIKAVALKNYLVEYSLLNEKDVDSVIIFDDYLVYSTAFGISNRITKQVNESMMNVNINLQILLKLLTL